MKKVPKMFTSKDLAYFKDIFDWNIVASKKLDHYLESIENVKMQELFSNISDMHYEICEELVTILESGEYNER